MINANASQVTFVSVAGAAEKFSRFELVDSSLSMSLVTIVNNRKLDVKIMPIDQVIVVDNNANVLYFASKYFCLSGNALLIIVSIKINCNSVYGKKLASRVVLTETL